MKDLKRMLATVLTLCLLAGTTLVFGDQRKDNPPPPKKDDKVVVQPEKKDPPRGDSGNKGGNEGRKGKP